MKKTNTVQMALLFAVIACVFTVASAREKAVVLPKRHVWPAPPDEPRIEFVNSLYHPRDIGQRVSKFAKIGRWLTGDQGEDQALQKPFGVAVDEDGNLCISDTGAKRISFVDFKKKQWKNIDVVDKVHFASPVAVAKQKGIYYVADSELARVFAFKENGKSVWIIAQPLMRPAGVAIASDLLAVAHSQAHAVFVFDVKGQFQFKFGERGTDQGQFNFPTHIAHDGHGHWLVTDSLNCRVQIFDLSGKFISEFGSNGDTSGHFSRPKGIAADSFGHIYVADAVFANFQVFDPAGRLLLSLGERGAGPGEFSMPGGIAISRNNEIYVADGYNHCVQVFKYIGAP
jgi:DNA-binding beta-propeller fold protein YncE